MEIEVIDENNLIVDGRKVVAADEKSGCKDCIFINGTVCTIADVEPKFKLGDSVRKVTGSNWHGTIVGSYSTELTPEGYCVESAYEKGSVQIYPAKALELWKGK